MSMVLTPRFEDALVYASRLHAGQWRKGSGVPYVAHLLAVAALVLEHGGGENEAIAALLHDAVEDQGGLETRDRIAERFGAAVAEIVVACSDSTVDAERQEKPPWRQRKEAYIARIRKAPAAVRLVSAADKVHNARCIVQDYRDLGEALWSRFNAGREETLWYYRAMRDVFLAGGPAALAEELRRIVAELEALVAEAPA